MQFEDFLTKIDEIKSHVYAIAGITDTNSYFINMDFDECEDKLLVVITDKLDNVVGDLIEIEYDFLDEFIFNK